MSIGEKLRDYTPGVTLAAQIATAWAYLGSPRIAVTVLIMLNAVWVLLYSISSRGRIRVTVGVLAVVAAALFSWRVLTKTTAEIVLPPYVPQKTGIEVAYDNVPKNTR